MTTFIWRFPLIRLVSGYPFPEHFVCAPNEMGVNPDSLINNRIWLIARSKDKDLLFGQVIIETVAIIDEGRDQGYFILETNRFCSFRILPIDVDKHSNWIISFSIDSGGISRCPDTLDNSLLAMLKRNERKSYTKPHLIGSNALPKPPAELVGSAIGRYYFLEALSRLTFGELERWGQRMDLSPFGNIVSVNCTESEYGKDAVREVTRLDSRISTLLELGGLEVVKHELAAPTIPTFVDTKLSCLDPDTIVTRKYFAAVETMDLGASLAKTQRAEFRHQAILRDISLFLKSSDVNILKSRSVDLAYYEGQKLCIAEVKSATSVNFIDQVRCGIIQLLEYKLAFQQDGISSIAMILFIEDIQDIERTLYARKLATSTNISLMTYNDKLAWPEKVEGISELVRHG